MLITVYLLFLRHIVIIVVRKFVCVRNANERCQNVHDNANVYNVTFWYVPDFWCVLFLSNATHTAGIKRNFDEYVRIDANKYAIQWHLQYYTWKCDAYNWYIQTNADIYSIAFYIVATVTFYIAIYDLRWSHKYFQSRIRFLSIGWCYALQTRTRNKCDKLDITIVYGFRVQKIQLKITVYTHKIHLLMCARAAKWALVKTFNLYDVQSWPSFITP